ncbi:transposase, partial [Acetobacterium sp.]|uniref:transposase n=1 Tax=Acetobacterium sp. TaxID=1872094 RepID=UPI0035932742
IIDFSFVYELVKDQYSPIGRGSKDPAMMVKIFLLEFLYRLSDVQVVNRIQTDIVFRELCPTQTYMVVFRRFPRHQLINLLE